MVILIIRIKKEKNIYLIKNKKMKILLLEKFPEIKQEYLEYLEKNNEIFSLALSPALNSMTHKGPKSSLPTNKKGATKNEEIDIIMIRSKIVVDEKLLDNYPNLKYVARIWVWLDKIDLELCEKRNIKVLNTPLANAESVADLVLAGILNLSRNMNLWFQGLEKRFEYMWNEFFQKTVWIIGFWNIWKKVYSRLKAFNVENFLIFDPFLDKKTIEENKFCTKVETKQEIFELSDIISFHIPLLEATKNFLWEKEINLLKKDVLIVNTSRWGIIDEKFLIKFLKENKSSRFFADVWEEENNLKNPKKELLELNQVLITPHIWAMTREAEEKMHFFRELV